MHVTAFALCILDYSNSKQKAKQYTENLITKLQLKINKKKNPLSWVSLIGF